MQRELSQDLLSGAQWQDRRWWARTETQEVMSEQQETLFYCEGDWTLAQVPQRHCGVFLQDTQKASGHGPGQLALVGPAKAGEWPLEVPSNLNHSLILQRLFSLLQLVTQIISGKHQN